MRKITYIFSRGRINRIIDDNYADDFFYGFRFLNKTNKFSTNIIEFQNRNYFFLKIEHILSKIISLPLYIFSLINSKNIKKFKETDNLILVSESTGFAALPLLIILKKRYNIKTHMFVMGLYSKKINIKILKPVHNYLIKFLIKYIDRIYFLGKNEFTIASKSLGTSEKAVYSSFHIDTKFWQPKNLNLKENKKILFVGNDGNRDFNLLINIAKKMQDKRFIFITSNEKILKTNLSNVEIINGNWSYDTLSDTGLRDIYLSARIVIIPLKNSTQPSGQSVALQSMSLGIPIIISKTIGFWDEELFVDEENIIFEQNGTVGSWELKINSLYHDVKKLQYLSKNSINLANKKFNLELFNNFLLRELDL